MIMSKPPSMTEELILYRIDERDRIAYVNAQWDQAAAASGAESVRGDTIVGKDLWRCITDSQVRSLYAQMIKHAREGRPMEFNYRCDTPDARRTYVMKIRQTVGREIEFSSQLLRYEPRATVNLLQASQPRSEDQFVLVCSWCELVALPSGEWVAVEQAVSELKLMEGDTMPQLTHGICEACAKEMLAKVKPPG